MTLSSHILPGAAARILDVQNSNGAIPWMEGGALDPWNHTEAAMALSAAGYVRQAEKAYDFLRHTQLPDGAWWGEYGNAVPMEDYTHLARTRPPRALDSNFIAYVATGVWHHYLATRQRKFLKQNWSMVRRAMDFVLCLQRETGDIAWCLGIDGQPADDALVAGCCSIYKSLGAAIAIGETLGTDAALLDIWARARRALGRALVRKPQLFDRQGLSNKRFSMDWYYPVLTGVLRGRVARARLAACWDAFVIEGLGCRCVRDQPWVTVAESCELSMALLTIGEKTRAQELFGWQRQWRAENGAYWMGYQYEENIIWPEEQPAWTSAAMILAADAFNEASATQLLFARHAPASVLDPA